MHNIYRYFSSPGFIYIYVNRYLPTYGIHDIYLEVVIYISKESGDSNGGENVLSLVAAYIGAYRVNGSSLPTLPEGADNQATCHSRSRIIGDI